MDEVEKCIGCVVRPLYATKLQGKFLYDDNKTSNALWHEMLGSEASIRTYNECRGDENASLDVWAHEKG